MVRRLAPDEVRQAWERLERRLGSLELHPSTDPDRSETARSDQEAYPTAYEAHLIVATDGMMPLPDEVFLAAIREGMVLLQESALYFLAREYAMGDEDQGLEWEVPVDHLTRCTLEAISPGFECYLYSVNDNGAIYFHHEGFAFCGGRSSFIGALRTNCQSHDPAEFFE
jgi:hypothetical protein